MRWIGSTSCTTRSLREWTAHSTELADTETGRYLINEAAQLLAALRLWAQNQYRSDEVVREILETADVVTLAEVAGELRETGGRETGGQRREVERREVWTPQRPAGRSLGS